MTEEARGKPATCKNCGATLGHVKTQKEAMNLGTAHASMCQGKEVEMGDDIARAQIRAIARLRRSKR